MKAALFCIQYASDLLLHDAEKDGIGSGQHLGTAAEILRQGDFRIVRVPVLRQEKLRPGQTEAVDALLHISHLEHIRAAEALCRKCRHQGLLDIVRVLVLVHQDLPQPMGIVVGDGRGPPRLSLSCIQDLQGKVLEIREIQHAPPGLFRLKARHKVPGQVHQHMDVFRHALLNPLLQRRRRQDQQLLQSLQLLLHAVPHIGHEALFLRFAAFQASEGDFLYRTGQCRQVRRRGCCRQPLQLLLQCGKIAFRAVLLLTDFQSIAVGIAEIPQAQPNVLEEICLRRGIAAFRLLQVFLRPGICRSIVKDPKDQLLHAAVVLPPGVAVGKAQKGLLLSLITFLQQLPDHIALQQAQFSLLAQPEGRVQTDDRIVLRDQPLAEGIDGADVCILYTAGLPDQPFIVRRLPETLQQPLPKALPHFLGRRIRKSHDQQLRQGHRVLRIRQPLQNMLHQHRGLAGAGGSRHQEIPLPMPDHLLLLLCPLHAHHFPPVLLVSHRPRCDDKQLPYFSVGSSLSLSDAAA